MSDTEAALLETPTPNHAERRRPQFSPLTQRRWANFKANKRGYWSLWIIGTLVFASLFAEVIANDKPIILKYKGNFYIPMIFEYPETEFGGVFETEAHYASPVVQDLVEKGNGWMLWPPIPFSHDTIDRHTEGTVPAAPSKRHWLGTDDVARDVTARLIYGFRLSVLFGLALTLITSVIGITVGSSQGYFGGLVDLIGQRVVEVWSGLPTLFVIIVLASIFEPNPFILLSLLVMFNWMALVAVVRAEFLRTRNFEYVNAARALGERDLKIMFKYVLPNAMVATLTFLPFILNGSITTLTSLDFLGFGLPAGYPSLGELLAQGKANLHAPWLGLSGFFTLAIMLTLLVFVGEGVRDAFDPRRAIN
ncbi:MAG: ABC transporter permease [Gammaproteobacteria bacterium]|nr:ABC transporter permease [Gammaproteobacteria bacterium]